MPKVFSVADGIDVLDFILQTPVDLLILDMVIAPSISGLETYKRIKKIRPDQKAILASGHSESEDVLKAQYIGAGTFVKKPYTILDMGIAVKEELTNNGDFKNKSGYADLVCCEKKNRERQSVLYPPWDTFIKGMFPFLK